MSIYPFGLNDEITRVGNMTRQNLIDFNFIDPYFIYPEKKKKRSRSP